MWETYFGAVAIIAVIYNLYENWYGARARVLPPSPDAPNRENWDGYPPPPPDAPNRGGNHSNITKQPTKRTEAHHVYTTPGRISYYELWKLVRYAFEEREDDKLEKAMKILMNDNSYVIPRSKYRSTDNQYRVYKDLCHWKKQCVNQIELLKKCIDADMVESMRRLRDLRRSVSNLPGSFSEDLKSILLHIGKKSTDNITNLLKNLNVENVDCDHSSGLEEIVNKALKKLDAWKKGLVPINPVVMLSLTLEDLGLSEGLEKFFQGPDEKSSPNSQDVNQNADRHRKKKPSHQPSTSHSINPTVDENGKNFPL